MARRPEHAVVVEAIYTAATEPDHWTPALDLLRRRYGADSAAISLQHEKRGTGTRIDVGYEHARRPNYFDGFAAINPLFDSLLRRPAGVAFPHQNLTDDALFRRGAYFNEYCRPNGLHFMAGAIIGRVDDSVEWMTLNRGRHGQSYDRAQLRGLDALLPHIRRASEMSRQLRFVRTARAAWEAALDALAQAIVLLDPGGRVVFANRAARGIDAECDGFVIRADRTVAAPWSGQALHTLIARATRGDADGVRTGGELTLPRREASHPLAARVVPLPQAATWPGDGRPAVLLLIVDPAAVIAPDPPLLMAVFGLTEREAALASLLAAGHDLNAAAASLGIGRETARTHLARALGKTGSARQPDLVRAVLAASIPGTA